MRPAMVSSRSTHVGLEQRRMPSNVARTSGLRATPAASIARCFAFSISTSLAFRAATDAADSSSATLSRSP
eukprot:CAMPEP_0181381732 /NCGR_PEP_ID=MMETSP1106-20121128/20305_1 /TAXON_ID=81844 /ORGANISM="Mantoniella antarctica, Strain SL-175" /LENGTH=70 /DNA_ID=CAMNT_0023500989 /DNA_START=87 /DNA_END=299 /DNA_ORIENTATION=+